MSKTKTDHAWGADGFCTHCHNVHQTDCNARSTCSDGFTCEAESPGCDATDTQATPLTDRNAASEIGFYSCATVPAVFARGLERQRNETRAAAEALAEALRDTVKSLEWAKLIIHDIPGKSAFNEGIADAKAALTQWEEAKK